MPRAHAPPALRTRGRRARAFAALLRRGARARGSPAATNFTFAGAWFRLGETEIHLLAEADTTGRAGMPDPGPGLAGGLATHIALEVDDLPGWQDRLRAHDVPAASGPMPRGDGVVQLFVRDPDGYVVELFQRSDEDQSDAPERAPIRG